MQRDARRNKPQIPRSAYWRKKVAQLAEQIGWQESALWARFEDLCLLTEYEMRIPRKDSEHAGWRLLNAMYIKSNCTADIN